MPGKMFRLRLGRNNGWAMQNGEICFDALPSWWPFAQGIWRRSGYLRSAIRCAVEAAPLPPCHPGLVPAFHL